MDAMDMLDERAAAKVLGISRGSLQQWRHHKRYPLRYYKIGAAVRYRPGGPGGIHRIAQSGPERRGPVSATLEYTPELVQQIVDSGKARQELREQMRVLAREDDDRQFAIGDLLAEGFEKYGHDVYEDAVRIFTKYTKASLQTMVSVARAVKPLLRNKDLSWSHHKAVARFEKAPETLQELLADAAKLKLPLQKFRSYIEEKYPDKKRPDDKPATKKLTLELPVEAMNALNDLGIDLGVETKEAARRLVQWALTEFRDGLADRIRAAEQADREEGESECPEEVAA